MYHMDMYRLENGGSDELGLEEYFEGQGIVIVEWSQFIQDELPLDYLVIAIHKDPDNDDIRQIEFQPKGQHYQQIVQQLEADYHDPSD
ncbi:ATPase YjeE [Agrilactobacillus composti DSM 18527 = JCM 14202]|nr:ATPase YjeE [Agrilactobacillus composti DSM 18527 = JCM 14202]